MPASWSAWSISGQTFLVGLDVLVDPLGSDAEDERGALGHDDSLTTRTTRVPRAVDALDTAQLDVGCGRRAGDEGERTLLEPVVGEPGQRFGQELDDLRLVDDADVEVGDECERAAAFVLRRP